ncbi:MAG TPA: hypothetical protein VN922_23615 [Bacteroidia bacterium]|nr:hypothetical protein [Bacteroidia bacterium]
MSKHLLLDIKTSNYEKLKLEIDEIPRRFSRFNVLSIRNQLVHKGDTFPTKIEILEACNAIEETIGIMESIGLYPNVYLFMSAVTDKFNRRSIEFSDYKDRKSIVHPTIEFMGSKLPPLDAPQIFIPVLNIGDSQENMRFIYEENSEYLRFWRKFPRKKKKIVEEQIEV